MLELFKAFHDLAPAVNDAIAAVVSLCTALQVIFLIAGNWLPRAAAIGHWLGIAALDLKQFGDGVKKATGKATSSLKGTNVAIVFLLALFVSGCGGSLNDARYAHQVESGKLGAAPPPSPYCQGVDSARSTIGFFGKLFAGGATVSAGSVAHWETEKADNAAAITAASLAAVSGALLWWSEDRSKRFVERCSQ